MDSIQFWIGLAAVVAAFGVTAFGVGVYIGIRVEQRDQSDTREALGVSNNSRRR